MSVGARVLVGVMGVLVKVGALVSVGVGVIVGVKVMVGVNVMVGVIEGVRSFILMVGTVGVGLVAMTTSIDSGSNDSTFKSLYGISTPGII